MFYIVCKSPEDREGLIRFLKAKGILAVFHYLSLHQSPFYQNKHERRNLECSDLYSERLVRLPLFFELADEQVQFIINSVKEFFQKL